MKTLNPAPKFTLWAVWRAVRHPKTPISYLYCAECKLRLPPDAKECPKCHDKVDDSSGDECQSMDCPERKTQSPVPWYASVVVMMLGIICCCLGAGLPLPGLDEAGRAMVYIPLGNMFGLTLRS